VIKATSLKMSRKLIKYVGLLVICIFTYEYFKPSISDTPGYHSPCITPSMNDHTTVQALLLAACTAPSRLGISAATNATLLHRSDLLAADGAATNRRLHHRRQTQEDGLAGEEQGKTNFGGALGVNGNNPLLPPEAILSSAVPAPR